MSRKKQPKDRRKPHGVALSAAEHERFTRAAGLLKISLSDYLRRAAEAFGESLHDAARVAEDAGQYKTTARRKREANKGGDSREHGRRR